MVVALTGRRPRAKSTREGNRIQMVTKGISILLVACLVMAAVGCGEAGGGTVKEIKIGVVGPMTIGTGLSWQPRR